VDRTHDNNEHSGFNNNHNGYDNDYDYDDNDIDNNDIDNDVDDYVCGKQVGDHPETNSKQDDTFSFPATEGKNIRLG
jgi:hypothetical protein